MGLLLEKGGRCYIESIQAIELIPACNLYKLNKNSLKATLHSL